MEQECFEELKKIERFCYEVIGSDCNKDFNEDRVEKLTKEFPAVCDTSLKHNQNPWHKQMRVCHREVRQLIPYSKIPLHNPGIQYPIRDVTTKEIDDLLKLLLSQGVIRRLVPGERAMFSPVLWL